MIRFNSQCLWQAASQLAMKLRAEKIIQLHITSTTGSGIPTSIIVLNSLNCFNSICFTVYKLSGVWSSALMGSIGKARRVATIQQGRRIYRISVEKSTQNVSTFKCITRNTVMKRRCYIQYEKVLSTHQKMNFALLSFTLLNSTDYLIKTTKLLNAYISQHITELQDNGKMKNNLLYFVSYRHYQTTVQHRPSK